ncbi:hypothetical protein ACEQPO_29765 [Bacillus sp. SL00103]
MLGGLFHTYQMMNILLTGAMFILIVYSLGANHSQLFSIIVIGVVLILLNANYMFRIRNRWMNKAQPKGCAFSSIMTHGVSFLHKSIIRNQTKLVLTRAPDV